MASQRHQVPESANVTLGNITDVFKLREILLNELCMVSGSAVSVVQSCPALCDPMDCRPPCSSVHGILQARILEWVAISFLLQGIFPTQVLNSSLVHLLHWQVDSLRLRYLGSA